eukprot:982274-Rhodomonas_salina.1
MGVRQRNTDNEGLEMGVWKWGFGTHEGDESVHGDHEDQNGSGSSRHPEVRARGPASSAQRACAPGMRSPQTRPLLFTALRALCSGHKRNSEQ